MVRRAILQRNADTVFGVFGYLDLLDESGQKVARYCTGEDDWLGNVPGKSCIPAGNYICRRSIWHKTSTPTFEVTGVPGRSRILIHWGNTEEDVEGCIYLGFAFGALTVADEDDPQKRTVLKWGIAAPSRKAFEEFMNRMKGIDDFPLTVLWASPGSWR